MSPRWIDLLNGKTSGRHQNNNDLQLLFQELRKKTKIVIVAGAGISEAAGIPEFRSRLNAAEEKDNIERCKYITKYMLDASVFSDNQKTKQFMAMTRELSQTFSSARPTAFHHLIAQLAKRGQIRRLYTQNIDDIDVNIQPLATDVPLSLTGPWPKTIQLHGSLSKVYCSKCSHIGDFSQTDFQGHQMPSCNQCRVYSEARSSRGMRSLSVGKLRPRISLYSEQPWDADAIGRVSVADVRASPDAVIVVGTALRVHGTAKLVQELCRATHSRRQGICIWLNIDCPPTGGNMKKCWDFVVLSRCDTFAHLYGIKE